MSGLYELSKEYIQLMEMAEEGELDPAELEEALLDLDDEIEVVAENCAKMIADLSGATDSLDTEIKRLQKRKAQNVSNMETIKKSLEKAMVFMKKEKFKTSLFGFAIQNNPPKVIVDIPEEIPAEYLVPQPAKADSAKIKSFLKGLKSPTDCAWAHLVQERSLRIK